jgi:hypothetical protein
VLDDREPEPVPRVPRAVGAVEALEQPRQVGLSTPAPSSTTRSTTVAVRPATERVAFGPGPA